MALLRCSRRGRHRRLHRMSEPIRRCPGDRRGGRRSGNDWRESCASALPPGRRGRWPCGDALALFDLRALDARNPAPRSFGTRGALRPRAHQTLRAPPRRLPPPPAGGAEAARSPAGMPALINTDRADGSCHEINRSKTAPAAAAIIQTTPPGLQAAAVRSSSSITARAISPRQPLGAPPRMAASRRRINQRRGRNPAPGRHVVLPGIGAFADEAQSQACPA
jgi:hypothetical protein